MTDYLRSEFGTYVCEVTWDKGFERWEEPVSYLNPVHLEAV